MDRNGADGTGARLPMVLDMLEWAYWPRPFRHARARRRRGLAKGYAARYATTDEAVATLIAWQSGKAGPRIFPAAAARLPCRWAMPAKPAGTLYIQLASSRAIAHLAAMTCKAPRRAPWHGCMTARRPRYAEGCRVRLGTS